MLSGFEQLVTCENTVLWYAPSGLKFQNVKNSCEPRFEWFLRLSLMPTFNPQSSQNFVERWLPVVSSFRILARPGLQFLFHPRQTKSRMCVLLIWYEVEMSGFCICTIPPNYYGSNNEWLHPNPEGRVGSLTYTPLRQPNQITKAPFCRRSVWIGERAGHLPYFLETIINLSAQPV